MRNALKLKDEFKHFLLISEGKIYNSFNIFPLFLLILILSLHTGCNKILSLIPEWISSAFFNNLKLNPPANFLSFSSVLTLLGRLKLFHFLFLNHTKYGIQLFVMKAIAPSPFLLWWVKFCQQKSTTTLLSLLISSTKFF